MSHDTLLDLSRWQWALTAAFHITFPAVTVGTSIFLVVCYAMYLRTDDDVWLRTFRFWRRIFAIGFTLGVVSGIVLTFEFGLNWGPFAHDVGPIVSVTILMEVVMAFFLEAGFLGLLIFGEGRISKRMMMFSTCMVSLGTVLSVTWILVANSWMQTPAGYKRVDGQFQPVNWLHVIFNPSFGIRFIHMLVGALIAAAWFICGISRRADVLLLDEPTEGLDTATAARLLAGVRAFDPSAALVIALHDRQSPALPWTPTARIALAPAVATNTSSQGA